LTEALSLLSSREGAKILAGGQSLVTLMKLRLAAPETLLDINGVTELAYIREGEGVIAIGALTRHDQLATSATIRAKCELLSEAAGVIADQQVRNRGTIGGSVAHADPTADLPTACTALDATVVTASLKDSRSIKSADFFKDYFSTALRQDEIIREVQIPIPPPGSGGAYVKLTKGHNDFALVAVAAQITIDRDLCRAASIVLGGVAPMPVHAANTERSLVGAKLNDRLIQESAWKASDGLSPPSDFRASSEYRLEMVRILTKRAIEKAVSRAQGGV
jgi:carbon-monoxide dehydrogenase medium subunit